MNYATILEEIAQQMCDDLAVFEIIDGNKKKILAFTNKNNALEKSSAKLFNEIAMQRANLLNL